MMYKEFQLANLPDSLSTLYSKATEYCFNWRICPTACQPLLFVFALNVAKFQLANLPDSLSTYNLSYERHLQVSIGEFARQPVNGVYSIQCRIQMFQLANLPDSLSTNLFTLMKTLLSFQLANLPDSLSTLLLPPKAAKTLFQLANLPDSLSTRRVTTHMFHSFNWRICPTVCQQRGKRSWMCRRVSIGEFARQSVNVNHQINELKGQLVSIGEFARQSVNLNGMEDGLP